MSCQDFCSNCGKPLSTNIFFSQSPIARSMRVNSLCFSCAYWKDYLSKPHPDTSVISGRLYAFHPILKPLSRAKSKREGMVFARNMKTGDAVACVDYAYIADIPDVFLDRMPDEYRFISVNAYHIINERIVKDCLAKGCWDRYHCFWYNAAKAEPNRPWNEIPASHKIGDEECESFIDKETMYNINNSQI